uniref:Branched-chain-amino-acid aminotransferase n=1 Tax=Ananas comosus var. bracteatus TaxID=296719 RepID=A0A6V7QNG3_ANACO|nr:unnamed protein product [Ananas comosus var. bracteatus]
MECGILLPRLRPNHGAPSPPLSPPPLSSPIEGASSSPPPRSSSKRGHYETKANYEGQDCVLADFEWLLMKLMRHIKYRLKIQSQLHPRLSLSLEAPSATRCEAAVASTYQETSGTVDLDWDNLGFGLVPTDFMYVMKCSSDGKFTGGELKHFGPIELSPSSGVLNYGQGLFEGLKAYRKEDGSILLFRPEENALRLRMGAERMCDGYHLLVKVPCILDRYLWKWGCSCLAPAPEYTFLIFVSPVGTYFKEGLAPINLIVEHDFIGQPVVALASEDYWKLCFALTNVFVYNVSINVLKAQKIAKEKGYSDVLYLDSVEKKYLEEVSSCNIFIVKGNVISTPALKGTILPGITRKSIIELRTRGHGFEVREQLISVVEELLEADEVFCTGTAVVLMLLLSVIVNLNAAKEQYSKFLKTCYKFVLISILHRVAYGNCGVGVVSKQLYSIITSLQMGLVEDTMGWTVRLD